MNNDLIMNAAILQTRPASLVVQLQATEATAASVWSTEWGALASAP